MEANCSRVGEQVENKNQEEKAHAEMIAEAKPSRLLEAEETAVEFVEKAGPDGRTFGSITNKKIKKNCSSLVLRLTNAISAC